MIRKRTVALLLTTLLLLGVLTGCGRQTGGSPGGWEDPPADPDSGLTEENNALTSVETPYGDLYYHLRWSDAMETRMTEEESCVKVSFLGLIGDESYPLFEVTIGEGEGDIAGVLTDAGGTRRNVHICMDTLPSLEEADMELLYAMQEEINTVIQNLK